MNRHLFFSGFLLLLFADQRLVPALPLYLLDGVALLFLVHALFTRSTERWKEAWTSPVGLLLIIILLAALVSLVAHPFTLTTWGQYKSWLLLPASMAFLYWFWEEVDTQKEILLFWYAGIILILLSLIPYVLGAHLTYDGRLSGSYASPNFLGFFLFPGVTLALAQWRRAARGEKWWHFGIGLAVLGALYLTHSYTAWLAALASAGVWFWLDQSGDRKKILLRVALLVFVFGGVLGAEAHHSGKLHEALSLGGHSSMASRIMIWQSAFFMIEHEPLLGIGIGNFQREYLNNQIYFPPYLEWAVPQPHNLYVALWLELGLLGAVATLGLIAFAIWNGWQDRHDPSTALLLSVFIGVLVYGLGDTPLFGNALAFVFWTNLFVLLFSRSPR